jgi:choice-of-anchor A domain-containing protein
LLFLSSLAQVCGNTAIRTYHANDFNLVSFNDLSSSGGDVEGRVLVGGDLTLGNHGFSIGDKIVNYPANAPFTQKNFSAIVGGNV